MDKKMDELSLSFKEKIRLAFATGANETLLVPSGENSTGAKADISQDLQNSEGRKSGEEESKIPVPKVAYSSKLNDSTRNLKERGATTRREHSKSPTRDVSLYGRGFIDDNLTPSGSSNRGILIYRQKKGFPSEILTPYESSSRGYQDNGREYYASRPKHRDASRPKHRDASRPKHRDASCHCCRANYKHLEQLRNKNRYGDYKFNDFDGAGVDIFKNSQLAPQMLPYKIVEGNRVEYFAIPNHRPLEGFVADFLKPENRKPVEPTEEQKAALEPDEYWDV